MQKKYEKIKIITEDKDFVAISKPAGILMHNTPNQSSNKRTLADWIITKYPETKNVGDDPEARPGIVHRLDKDTSGILIVARTQAFFAYFKKLLQTRKIKKTYIALVHGKIEETKIIDVPIGLRSGTTKHSALPHGTEDTTRAKNLKMVKEAITEIRPVKTFELLNNSKTAVPKLLSSFSLVKALPKTGRTHQIRVHLAHIGRPIVGDPLYGQNKNNLGLNRQFLHAESLEFSLENGTKLNLAVDMPKELENVLKQLSTSQVNNY